MSQEDANKNARLKILRKRLEQHFQKYFWDLCAIGDANNDGNIDLGINKMFSLFISVYGFLFQRRMA